MDIFLLFLAGLLGGFFAGLLGIGGGIVYIAILPFALRSYGLSDEILVAAVIANSILATFFAALLSLHRHYLHKNIYLANSLFIGIPGAITLISLYVFVIEKGNYEFQYFNIFILLILFFMLLRHFRKSVKDKMPEKKATTMINIGIGASGGALSAFSGLGGGAIVVPMLVSLLRMDIKKATSVSMGFIFFASLGMSIYNILFSNLDLPDTFGGVIYLPVVVPLITGVILAAPFGVKAARKISSRTLTILFMVFVLLVMFSRFYDLLTQ